MRILLAVDGSQRSDEAARALAHLATPADVIILNVLEIPDLAYQSRWLRMKDLSLIVEKEMRQDAEDILQKVTSHLPSEGRSLSPQIKEGKAADVILDRAAQANIDLIAMGARGQNRLSQLVFGSVSHRVMTHASCSTLLVKSAIPRLQQVLLPIEGGEDVKRATAFLAKMPFQQRPVITVFHVVPIDEPYWLEGAMTSPSYREELMVAGQATTNQAVSQLTNLGYQAEPLLRYGPPAELIQAAVAEKTPDLIVMGSHGRKGLSRFFLGSVSHSVVHRAPCSVLVVR